MCDKSPLTLILAAESGTDGTWQFTGPSVVLIGRDHRCNIHPAPDDDMQGLSRFHAVIEIGPGKAVIRDLSSLAGTWLNGHLVGQRPPGGQRAESGQEAQGEGVELADGDIITMGPWWLRVSMADPDSDEVSHQPAVTCAGCGGPRPSGGGWPDGLCDQCRTNPVAALKLLRTGLSRRIPALAPLKGLRVDRTLGRGATSAVFLVTRKKSETRLALKVMPPSVSDNNWARKSFLREVALGRALNHPNVARLYESGQYAGAYFVLMEYCSGGSSEEERVKSGGRLSVEGAVSIILSVLDGLDYLHNVHLAPVKPSAAAQGAEGQAVVGLVHRDLKPANIFLGGDSGLVPKIADIGVAKFYGQGGSCDTRTGTVAGSPATMPRQQAVNFKYAGPEVDVWAAAASLFKLLTGEYPREFPAERDPWEVVMNENPRPLLSLLPDAPPALARVVDEALVDDPAIKYQRADDLKTALLGAVEEDDILL